MPNAHGATFTVTSEADSGPGSLRAALAAADSSAGADVIDFAPGIDNIALSSQLTIMSPVTIAGPGASGLTISGSDATRVFWIGEAGDDFPVTIRGLTITDGFFEDGSGGAIYADDAAVTLDRVVITGNTATQNGGVFAVRGTLSVTDSTISGNTAQGPGGAIGAYDNPVTILRSTISGNTAQGPGGAIWAYNAPVTLDRVVITGNTATTAGGVYALQGTLSVTDSTISGNTARSSRGGAISIAGGESEVATELAIVNSTISGNTAQGPGGGGGGVHASFGTSVTVSHSTITGNAASAGRARYGALPGGAAEPLPGPGNSFQIDDGATLTLSHSIVNGVTANGLADIFGGGTVSASYTLVRDGSSPLPGTGNLVGVDPQLGPLADNGGPTRTHLPAATSPAINAGNPAITGAPATDQRGLARIADARIDLGAVEVAPPPPSCDLNSFIPKRVLDTRNGIGAPKTPVGPGGLLTIQVAGRAGLPTTGIKAVIVNVTAAQSSEPSFVTAWPADKPRPTNSSTLNTEPGQDVPNLAVVELSADGKLSLYNSAGTTNLVVDVLGYLGTCSTFTPVGPSRLLDTRNAVGAPAAKIGAGQTIGVQAAGIGGVPATGASAVVVNLTTTQASASSFVTAWPSGEPRPDASTLNTEPGVDVPNLAVVRLGTDGKFNLFNELGTTHLLADVVGYFPDAASTLAPAAPIGFVPITPLRVLDSRRNLGFAGPAQAGRNYDVALTGIPAGTKAVVINLTSTASTHPGFVTAWAAGAQFPDTSNVNTEPGVNVANLAIVSLSADGKISLYNSHGTTHLIGDIVGYFPAESGA